MSTNPNSKLHSAGMDFTSSIRNDTYDYIKPTQFDLNGRAVLITGASKGCGRAAAISFARAGASQIAIAARSTMSDLLEEMKAAAKEAGRKAPQLLSLEVDVTSESSVEAAAKKVESDFGRLDVLINNAGYLENFKPIAESDPKDWWRVWEVNIKGPYLVARFFLPMMLGTEKGLKTVLNTSSIGAHYIMPGASGYQSGKLALLRIAEFMNVEYEKQDLLAFCIHPGAVMTELASGMPKSYHDIFTDTPALSADSIVWLTAERREWLRGRYVSCNWDMEELLGKRKEIEDGDLLKVRMDVGGF